MANSNNSIIVDRAIDILSNSYTQTLRNSYRKNGLQYKGTVDFSELKQQIMACLESGQVDNIESIINSFVMERIENFDKTAGEMIAKRGYSGVHRRVMDDLIGFSHKINEQCAEAISKNVKVKTNEQLSQDSSSKFRESLKNFTGDKQERKLSTEEVLQRNAQSIYEKTGNIPEGYILNNDGKVIKDTSKVEIAKVESKDNSKDDMEFGE